MPQALRACPIEGHTPARGADAGRPALASASARPRSPRSLGLWKLASAPARPKGGWMRSL
jgi:hypothetical protein